MDGGTGLTSDGHGAPHDGALHDLGAPDRSELGRETSLLEIADVDPQVVVMVRAQPGAESPWIAFVRVPSLSDRLKPLRAARELGIGFYPLDNLQTWRMLCPWARNGTVGE